MRFATAGIYSLAILVICSGVLLALAPRLPEEYSHSAADAAIASALVIYALCWLGVLLGVLGRRQVAAAWKSRQKPALAASTILVFAFLALASWQILAVLQSTDL